MSQSQVSYITSSRQGVVKVEYVDDVPDVREYLMNLRRDLLRKVRDIEELLARMPQDKP